MRKDLKKKGMNTGKAVAQGGHAVMKFLAHKIRDVQDNRVTTMAGEHFPVFLTQAEENWILGKFTKICLAVNSEEELLEIHQKALDAGLTSCLVTDNGQTVFKGVPTNTCIGIGPDEAEKIDAVTGGLKLY